MSEDSKKGMANEESFILLSLKEKQSKKLAQVISSDKCRIILEYMASKDFVTETDIAKDLKLPLSTVHYNIKALHETRMLTADEFHYSEKGKEVPHYKLANKFIIIAPKEEKSVMDRLRKFMPIGALVLGLGAVFTFGAMLLRGGGNFARESYDMALRSATPKAFEDGLGAVPEAATLADESLMMSLSSSPVSSFPWLEVSIAFVAGFLLAAFLVFLWNKCKSKKRK